MIKMKVLKLEIVLLFAVIICSCSTSNGSDPMQDNYKSALNASYLIWSQSKPTNYTYEYWKVLLGVPKYSISVSNFEVIGVIQLGGIPFKSNIISNDYQSYSIESIFIQISNNLLLDYYKRSLTFNTQYGYPESAAINYYEHTYDEEFGILITNFNITNY
jgi:hypothetical protein